MSKDWAKQNSEGRRLAVETVRDINDSGNVGLLAVRLRGMGDDGVRVGFLATVAELATRGL